MVKMSEDMNLRESLERLEINSKRPDSVKTEQPPGFSQPSIITDPECSLKTLSLKAECTKGSCQCNKKKSRDTTLKRVTFKRPILRRSKLSPGVLLRAPVLKLNNDTTSPLQSKTKSSVKCTGGIGRTPCTSSGGITGDSSSVPECDLLSSGCKLPVPSRIDEDLSCSSSSTPVGIAVATQPNVYSAGGSSGSCSIQARRAASSSTTPPPDDTNIDELASYFDLFVHIPKKMSLMAEMMYI